MTTTEKIVTGAAVFISLLALFVSIQQTKIMSEQKSASVWPYVQIGTSFGTKRFQIDVDNDGVGPAKIKDVVYSYKDTTFNFIHELVLHIYNEYNLEKKFMYNNIEGGNQVLLARESKTIFEATPDSSAVVKKLMSALSDISITIKYCSIYDECWINEDGQIREE